MVDLRLLGRFSLWIISMIVEVAYYGVLCCKLFTVAMMNTIAVNGFEKPLSQSNQEHVYWLQNIFCSHSQIDETMMML